MSFEYNNPIIHKRRIGSVDDPFISITESLTLDNNAKVILTEIPSDFHKVQVSGEGITWKEVTSGEVDTTDKYKVDYKNKIITFHLSHAGKQLSFSYMGTGLTYVPTNMIYTQENNGEITETLKQLTDTTAQARQDVIDTDNLVQQHETTREANETARQNAESTRELEHDIAMQDIDDVVDRTKYISQYDPAITYQPNNMVTFNGSTFIAKQQTIGNAPPDIEVATENLYWGLVGRKGSDGTGTVKIRREEFIATEGQTVFTLQYTYDQFQNRTKIYVDGFLQDTPDNYEETTNKTITLSEGLTAGQEVIVEYFSESVPLASDIQTTVDNHTTTLSNHATTLNNHTTILDQHSSDLAENAMYEMFPSLNVIDVEAMTVGDFTLVRSDIILGTVTLG